MLLNAYRKIKLLRGYYTSYPKISIFVLYLKISNTFLINDVCILKKIVQGTQK